MIAKIGFTYSSIKQKKRNTKNIYEWSFMSLMRMNTRKMKRMFCSDLSWLGR